MVLFVDAGRTEGKKTDVADMLKPALARGRLSASPPTRRWSGGSRRYVAEPGEDDTLAILRQLRASYQEHHGMGIQDEAYRYVLARWMAMALACLADRHTHTCTRMSRAGMVSRAG